MNIELIDSLLLSSTTGHWRKVAMVISLAMNQNQSELSGMDDVFLISRIAYLADTGRIQARGDINLMRHSEIRLPQF